MADGQAAVPQTPITGHRSLEGSSSGPCLGAGEPAQLCLAWGQALPGVLVAGVTDDAAFEVTVHQAPRGAGACPRCSHGLEGGVSLRGAPRSWRQGRLESFLGKLRAGLSQAAWHATCPVGITKQPAPHGRVWTVRGGKTQVAGGGEGVCIGTACAQARSPRGNGPRG